METLESRLREKLGQPVPYTRDSVADLLVTARRTRRRRTVLTGASSVLAVVVVALGVPLLLRTMIAPPAPVRPMASTSATAPTSDVASPNGLLLLAGFADAENGFLVTVHCPERLGVDCVFGFAATTDGGTTYQQRTSPEPFSAVDTLTSRLYVFDADHAVFAGAAQRRVTSDGGRTWSTVRTLTGVPLAAIPVDGRLCRYCLAGPGGGLAVGPGAGVMTPDGVAHRLTTAPTDASVGSNSSRYTAADTAAIDGRYFLYVSDGTAAMPSRNVEVSTDSGATWTKAWTPANVGDFTVVGGDGRRVFAQFTASEGIAPTSIAASSDGGLTWQVIGWARHTPVRGTDGLQSYDTAAVSPDGGLVVSAFNTTWLLAPGDTVLRPADVGLGTDQIICATNGPLVAQGAADGEYPIRVSVDGVHWRTIKLS